jgi:hypothetical protein
VKLKPEEPLGRYTLGFCYLGTGRYEEATEELLEYRDSLTWSPGFEPSPADWARDVEILVRLARRLPGVLEAGAEIDPAERRHLLWLCQDTRYYVAGTRLAEELFREDPAAKRAKAVFGVPCHAAGAAAAAAISAAMGHGEGVMDLDNEERRRLRALARDWLEDELRIWTDLVDRGDERDRENARVACCWFLQADQRLLSPGFGPVREKSNLRKLPREEAEAWRELWAAYRRLYERVAR